LIALALALMIVASPAFPRPAGDLAGRLSQAYATYCDHLQKEGRENELTMSGVEKVNNWTDERWFGPRDSTWIKVKRPVVVPMEGWIQAISPGGGRLLESHAPPTDEGYDCRDAVSAGFEIAHEDSLFFTVGRAPEACNETPFMIRKQKNMWGAKEGGERALTRSVQLQRGGDLGHRELPGHEHQNRI
jgi:hypothetical protein